MIHFILASLLLISAHAHEMCSGNMHPELQDLINLEKAIDWTAASDTQIRNAPCTRDTPFSEDEMKSWMSANDSTPRINKTINGISFEDESFENLESFRHLTTFVDIIGEPIPEKQRTFNSSCKKVECAVKEIFGNDTGIPLLFMQRKFGLNGSHIIKESNQATAWQRSELDTVLLGLSDFPDGVMPTEDSRTMIHAPRSHGNGNTIANAVITVYQLWNEQSPEQQRSTIVHEMGHVLAFETDIHDHEDWNSESGWTERTVAVNGQLITRFETSNPDAIISEYGLSNPREDFAESVVAYRYNPGALKSASPEKYNLIKELIYDNVEYTSEAACSNPDRMSTRLIQEVEQELANWSPSQSELAQISSRCSSLVVDKLAVNPAVDVNSPEFQNCYNRSLAAQTSEVLKTRIENLPNKEFLGPMLRNARVNLPPQVSARVSEAAKNFHRTDLRAQIASAISGTTYCRPGMAEYAYQGFEDERLGVNTYRLRNELNTIASNACAMTGSSSPTAVAVQMIR